MSINAIYCTHGGLVIYTQFSMFTFKANTRKCKKGLIIPYAGEKSCWKDYWNKNTIVASIYINTQKQE